LSRLAANRVPWRMKSSDHTLYEDAMALLLLHKRKSVRIGLIIGEAYLLAKKFHATFFNSMLSKLRQRPS
jgi:hypothetical protein